MTFFTRDNKPAPLHLPADLNERLLGVQGHLAARARQRAGEVLLVRGGVRVYDPLSALERTASAHDRMVTGMTLIVPNSGDAAGVRLEDGVDIWVVGPARLEIASWTRNERHLRLESGKALAVVGYDAPGFSLAAGAVVVGPYGHGAFEAELQGESARVRGLQGSGLLHLESKTFPIGDGTRFGYAPSRGASIDQTGGEPASIDVSRLLDGDAELAVSEDSLYSDSVYSKLLTDGLGRVRIRRAGWAAAAVLLGLLMLIGSAWRVDLDMQRPKHRVASAEKKAPAEKSSAPEVAVPVKSEKVQTASAPASESVAASAEASATGMVMRETATAASATAPTTVRRPTTPEDEAMRIVTQLTSSIRSAPKEAVPMRKPLFVPHESIEARSVNVDPSPFGGTILPQTPRVRRSDDYLGGDMVHYLQY